MNCFNALSFSCFRLQSPFGASTLYEQEPLSQLYKERQDNIEADEAALSGIEIAQVDGGLSGWFRLMVISIENLFSLVAFGSRKWAFILSENSLDSSRSIYMNTWSSTAQENERFHQLREDCLIKKVWHEVQSTGKPVYISRKEGSVKVSCYLTSEYIFKHIKKEKDIERGGLKKCDFVETQNPNLQAARLSLRSKGDKEKLERLRKEICFLEKLKGCPFVIQMLAADKGRTNFKGQEKLAIYLDLYNQGDLLSYLNFKKPLDNSVKMDIAGGLIEGLKGIHNRGIAHNDMKLENILIRDTGESIEPAICDFDLATEETSPNGSIGGTFKYCSPEKIYANEHSRFVWGHQVRKCADVWALGLVLSILFWGARPYWFDQEWYDISKTLSEKYRCRGSFFDEPQDRGSINHLIWEMVQYQHSKRPTMDEVANRWAALSSP